MIAKLIVHAPTREAAARKLAAACREVEVWPVKTNAGFLARALNHADFVTGGVDTGFIAARLDDLVPSADPPEAAWRAAAAARIGKRVLVGFRLNAPRRIEAELQSGEARKVVSLDQEPDPSSSLTDGETVVVFREGEAYAFTTPRSAGLAAGAGGGAILAPMPGRIVAAPASAGQSVSRGQALVVLEAMKMEHTLTAPFDGVVAELTVVEGDQVAEGLLLVRLEAEAD
jgi:3-methylcrotonyl-CoA carboxylase alpha subunit